MNTYKRSVRKTPKRSVKRTVRRTPKRVVKRSPKKSVRKTPKRTVKRSVKRSLVFSVGKNDYSSFLVTPYVYGNGVRNRSPEANALAMENVQKLKRWFMVHGNRNAKTVYDNNYAKLINVTREGNDFRFHFDIPPPLSISAWELYGNPDSMGEIEFVTLDGRRMNVYGDVQRR
jgi:hypothetical protein